jgi:hypothetical protein
MNCEESKNLMTISVYGRLTPAEKDRLETHLKECPRCAGQYEKVSRLSGLFVEKEDVPLPDKEKSWQVISADLFRKRPRWLTAHPSRKPLLGFSWALLLLVVGFGAGYFVRSGGQKNADMAQLRREVLEIREITAASFLRQESLNMGLRGMGSESLAAPAEENPLNSLLQVLVGDPHRRREFLDSLSEQTSPVVEIALALARHMETL